MSLSGLIPTDLSLFSAVALCAIAFVAGTSRGFSGFAAAVVIGLPALDGMLR